VGDKLSKCSLPIDEDPYGGLYMNVVRLAGFMENYGRFCLKILHLQLDRDIEGFDKFYLFFMFLVQSSQLSGSLACQNISLDRRFNGMCV
jgi:hypothetical protein